MEFAGSGPTPNISDWIAVEVYLDDNCCPESIQTHIQAPWSDVYNGISLAFGPVIIEDYFESNGSKYDLAICDDVGSGVCCITGEDPYNSTRFQCEVIGNGVLAGTWYPAGTYDPLDPCSGDPFP
jgi:hypothetical protein